MKLFMCLHINIYECIFISEWASLKFKTVTRFKYYPVQMCYHLLFNIIFYKVVNFSAVIIYRKLVFKSRSNTANFQISVNTYVT